MYTIFWLGFLRDSRMADGFAVVVHECTEMRNGVDGGRELM